MMTRSGGERHLQAQGGAGDEIHSWRNNPRKPRKGARDTTSTSGPTKPRRPDTLSLRIRYVLCVQSRQGCGRLRHALESSQ